MSTEAVTAVPSHPVLAGFGRGLAVVGDWAEFSGRALRASIRRWPTGRQIVPICYDIGVSSIPVVIVTGVFIGMVLAVQTYAQFAQLGLQTWIGSMIHISAFRELGPVLAATMLAGRIGSAMAAEIGTMRVTEQIDALACLGVDPVQYLVVPRFIACVLLVPLLTIVADVMAILGASMICLSVYQIEPHHYWMHSRDFIGVFDVTVNLIKPAVFGGFIALVCCHRGFNSSGGSEGVGRAATEAFVASFIGILILDFFLGMFINSLQLRINAGVMPNMP